MEISKEEFNVWLRSDVTQKLISMLENDRKDIKDSWEEGGFNKDVEPVMQGSCSALLSVQRVIESGEGIVSLEVTDGNA